MTEQKSDREIYQIYRKNLFDKPVKGIAKECGVTVVQMKKIARKERQLCREEDELYVNIRKFTHDNIAATRVYNTLLRAGIFRTEQLKNYSEDNLREIQNLGAKKLEIVMALKKAVAEE